MAFDGSGKFLGGDVAPKSGGGDGANEKETIQAAIDATKKIGAIAPKLVGLPVNLSSLGEVSVAQALGGDTEGWASKSILPGIAKANGGVLAQIAAALIKNGVISDHTGGVGGDSHNTYTSGSVDSGLASAPRSTGGGGGVDLD